MMQNNVVDNKPTESMSLILLLCLIAGPFLTMLNSNLMNVALPNIASAFNSSLTDVQWVLSIYLLALAAVLVSCAFLSKRFGASKVYLASLIGFTVFSAACAFAPSLGWMIAARALQGAFGAPLLPVVMDVMLGGNSTGKRKVPIEFGLILFLAPALGPTAGGLLMNYFSWQALFLVNVPVGLAAALMLMFDKNTTLSRRDVTDKNIGFDVVGTVALAAGLVLTLYGSTEGPTSGWLSAEALPYLVAGAALIAFYLAWALKMPRPAIDLKLLRTAETALTLLISVVAVITAMAILFLVPLVMQSVQGYSALDAGLAMLPQGILLGIGVAAGDAIYNKKWLSVRALVTLGMLLLAASTASLLLFDMSTPIWASAIILGIRGLATGITIQPLLYEMLSTLLPTETPDGNTLFNVMQRLGGSVGISAISTLFQSQAVLYIGQVLSSYHIAAESIHIGQSAASLSSLPAAVRDQVASATFHGFHDAVLALVGLALLGLCFSLFLKPARQKEEDIQAKNNHTPAGIHVLK